MGIVEGVVVALVVAGAFDAIWWTWRRVQRWRAQRPDDDMRIY
jgi:hypothetical protein